MPRALAHHLLPPRPSSRARRGVLVAVTALCVLVGGVLPQSARASHYRFERIELLTKAEQRALARVGVQDTRALLARTQTLVDRVWLARATGITLERLTTLATQCDLLRVGGVGPTMVVAFQKAGVPESSALAQADAAELLSRLQVATTGTPMRARLPDTSILDVWIEAARRSPSRLRDLPTAPRPPGEP